MATLPVILLALLSLLSACNDQKPSLPSDSGTILPLAVSSTPTPMPEPSSTPTPAPKGTYSKAELETWYEANDQKPSLPSDSGTKLPLIISSTPTPTPEPSPTPTPAPKGTYNKAELETWYEALDDVIWNVAGIASSGVSNDAYIEIHMYPVRGAREKMEAAISNTNVPRQAVVINMGCEDDTLWPPEDQWESPDEDLRLDIVHSLEISSQESYGQTVTMKQTLRNVSLKTVVVGLGYAPSHNFIVSTPDGDLVWHWLCAKFRFTPIVHKTLEPGDAVEFVGEWDQVDNRGEPVPPGIYLVRGVLDGDERNEMFVTDTLVLEVIK